MASACEKCGKTGRHMDGCEAVAGKGRGGTRARDRADTPNKIAAHGSDWGQGGVNTETGETFWTCTVCGAGGGTTDSPTKKPGPAWHAEIETGPRERRGHH